MSASIARRTTILLSFYRTTTTTTARISRPTSLPSIPSNSMPRCPSLRVLRRELSSLQPLYSSIAAACLVSKLPNLAASSSEVGGAMSDLESSWFSLLLLLLLHVYHRLYSLFMVLLDLRSYIKKRWVWCSFHLNEFI